MYYGNFAERVLKGPIRPSVERNQQCKTSLPLKKSGRYIGTSISAASVAHGGPTSGIVLATTAARSAVARLSHTIPSRSDQQQRHNRRRLPGENGERPSSDPSQERRRRKDKNGEIPAETWETGVPTVAGWRLTGVAFFVRCRIFGNSRTLAISPQVEVPCRIRRAKKWRRKNRLGRKGF
jgi:hypothetical protein